MFANQLICFFYFVVVEVHPGTFTSGKFPGMFRTRRVPRWNPGAVESSGNLVGDCSTGCWSHMPRDTTKGSPGWNLRARRGPAVPPGNRSEGRSQKHAPELQSTRDVTGWTWFGRGQEDY